MNLTFNFHDRLFWIQNFLPENLYKEMYINFIKTRNNLDYKKTTVGWPTFKEEQDNMSNSYGQRKTDNEINNYLFKYHTILRYQKFVNFMKVKFDSHLRKYNYGQHLGWHSDDDENNNRQYAVTFYFNKTWKVGEENYYLKVIWGQVLFQL
jgi:Rps23 Pro-64 3,4-dihydroxylase Tpa1-like proline 4-hydroxylase